MESDKNTDSGELICHVVGVTVVATWRVVPLLKALLVVELSAEVDMANVQLGVPPTTDFTGRALVQAAKFRIHGDSVVGSMGHLGLTNQAVLLPTGQQKCGPDF